MLGDMRWAYKHLEDGKEGTASQEQFRKLYADNPEKFLERLGQLERQYRPVRRKEAATGNPVGRPVQPPEVGAPPAPADPGEAKCVELVERLLEASGWRAPGAGPPQP